MLDSLCFSLLRILPKIKTFLLLTLTFSHNSSLSLLFISTFILQIRKTRNIIQI